MRRKEEGEKRTLEEITKIARKQDGEENWKTKNECNKREKKKKKKNMCEKKTAAEERK